MNVRLSSGTLPELLEPIDGERTALVFPEDGTRVSYASLREQVRDVADAAAAGTAAPLNAAYREDEFRFYLEDTEARLLVLPVGEGDEARRAAGGQVPIVTASVVDGRVRLSPDAVHRTAGSPSPDDSALVLHTSGSTGRPKRVPLKHSNLVTSVGNIIDTYALGPDDVSLCVMPLFHVHGLMASLMATLASGGTVVVPPRFNALGFWRIVREHGVTWYSAVPTMHQLLLARVGKEERVESGLRFIRSCSASLAPETMQAMESAFGVPVLEAYGMTEASHQMASNPLPPGVRKPGSVGPGTGVRVGIMDKDSNLLAPGEHGEVVIQGANVITGYENNPEANATSFSDGWFRTGDQGFLDANGYLMLVGRLKELINRGGEKISPREIDEVLLTHPAIAEAVAFGVPHRMWGEEVAAAVVLREGSNVTEADLVAFCRERLAEFKAPKKIHIVQAIPRTATGKLQRRVVAAAYGGQQP